MEDITLIQRTTHSLKLPQQDWRTSPSSKTTHSATELHIQSGFPNHTGRHHPHPKNYTFSLVAPTGPSSKELNSLVSPARPSSKELHIQSGFPNQTGRHNPHPQNYALDLVSPTRLEEITLIKRTMHSVWFPQPDWKISPSSKERHIQSGFPHLTGRHNPHPRDQLFSLFFPHKTKYKDEPRSNSQPKPYEVITRQ